MVYKTRFQTNVIDTTCDTIDAIFMTHGKGLAVKAGVGLKRRFNVERQRHRQLVSKELTNYMTV